MPLFTLGKPPKEAKELWVKLIDFFQVFNSRDLGFAISDTFSRDEIKKYDELRKLYVEFLNQFAKSVGIKFNPQKRLRDRSYKLSAKKVGALIQKKSNILNQLILKRKMKFNLEGLIRHYLTLKNFNSAKQLLQTFQIKMRAFDWSQIDDVGTIDVDLDSSSMMALAKIFQSIPVDQLSDVLISGLNNRNVSKVLNSLSFVPEKAYDPKIVSNIIDLLTSGMLNFDMADDIKAIEYWGKMPRSRVKKLLEGLNDKDLQTLAPFLNLTIDEIDKLNLHLNDKFIRKAVLSAFPAIRKFWITSRRYPVYPILYMFKKQGKKLSTFELQYANLFETKLKLAKMTFPKLNKKDWEWIKPDKVPPFESGWNKFETKVFLNSSNTAVDLIGAYYHETTHIYLVFYTTVYGSIESRRKDDEIISYYVYSEGESVNWGSSPKKDRPYSIMKTGEMFNEAFSDVQKLTIKGKLNQ